MRSSAVFLMLAAALSAGPARAAEPAEVLCARGVQSYQAGDLAGAAALLGRALDQDPTLTAAGHYLGLALVRQGKLQEGRRALAAAARQAPRNPRLLMDLGLAYLAEGNAAWAVRYLGAARDLAPRDARIRYHLAGAMLRLGESASAIAELKEARHAPAEVPREAVNLQLGLAHYLNQDWEQSRRHLDTVVFSERGAAARQLLRSTYEAQGTQASWISARLVAGGVVDTNPLFEAHRTSAVGAGPTLSGALVIRPWADARNLFSGELSGARSFLFPTTGERSSDSHAADGSPTDLGAALSYARRFPVDGGAWRLSLGYAFAMTFLDGAELTDDSNIFVETSGGSLALQYARDDGATVQLRYGLSYEAFYELPRNNLGNELTLEHSRNLLDNRLRFLGWLGVKHELAEHADYRALTPGVGVGLSYLGPLDLVFGVRFGYEHENYYDSAESRRWGKQRLDNTLSIAAEVGRALFWGLRLRAVYQRQQKFSTVDSYQIHRDMVTLGLSWSYR